MGPDTSYQCRPIGAGRIAAFAGAALAACLAPVAATAQAQTGTVRVVLVQPFSLVEAADLDFGSMIAGTTAGTVTIAPAGTRSATGGVIPAAGSFGSARFVGMGTPNRQIRLRFPSATATLTAPGGATMTASNFTIGALVGIAQLGASGNYRITSASGVMEFRVGARLAVAANQAPGDYAGTFQMTFDYQ